MDITCILRLVYLYHHPHPYLCFCSSCASLQGSFCCCFSVVGRMFLCLSFGLVSTSLGCLSCFVSLDSFSWPSWTYRFLPPWLRPSCHASIARHAGTPASGLPRPCTSASSFVPSRLACALPIPPGAGSRVRAPSSLPTWRLVPWPRVSSASLPWDGEVEAREARATGKRRNEDGMDTPWPEKTVKTARPFGPWMEGRWADDPTTNPQPAIQVDEGERIGLGIGVVGRDGRIMRTSSSPTHRSLPKATTGESPHRVPIASACVPTVFVAVLFRSLVGPRVQHRSKRPP